MEDVCLKLCGVVGHNLYSAPKVRAVEPGKVIWPGLACGGYRFGRSGCGLGGWY
jgi:hypothetical protein